MVQADSLSGELREAALFVAADRIEYSGLLSHCRKIGKLPWPMDYACRAELGGQPVVLVANGMGPRLAAAAAETAGLALRYRAVVSTGFCGALDPAIPLKGIVVATEVRQPSGESMACEPPACSRPFHAGLVLSQDRIAQTRAEKGRLRLLGGCAVEMEAAGVASVVRQWNLPFYCIRAVTDGAEEGFKLDLNSARRLDGRLSAFRVLKQSTLLGFPGFAELIRLRRRSMAAACALGDFLADCRF